MHFLDLRHVAERFLKVRHRPYTSEVTLLPAASFATGQSNGKWIASERRPSCFTFGYSFSMLRCNTEKNQQNTNIPCERTVSTSSCPSRPRFLFSSEAWWTDNAHGKCRGLLSLQHNKHTLGGRKRRGGIRTHTGPQSGILLSQQIGLRSNGKELPGATKETHGR